MADVTAPSPRGEGPQGGGTQSEGTQGGAARRAVRSIAQDVTWGAKSWFANSLGGFVLTPRVVRYGILRLRGLSVRTPNISPRCTFTGGTDVTIGPGTFLNVGCYLEAVAPIRIGVDCQLAMFVTIVTSFHGVDGTGVSRARSSAPVTIGDRCWLGAHVTVLPGVTIGDDVVVAAGAVVTKDLPSRGVYGGVPARLLRTLDETPAPTASGGSTAG